jgi:RNA polymerase sigma factor (sigma-70 family)
LSKELSGLTAAELVRACLEAGAEDAWRELVQRTRRMIGLVVLRSCRRWTEPSPTLVEDLIQETYLKLCENRCRALREFQPHNEDALFGYVKVIALHVTNDYVKGLFAQKRRTETAAAPADSPELGSDHEAARHAMERDILLQQIDAVLRTPHASGHPRDREIFWLYYRGGLSARAIAEIPAIGGGIKFVERRLARLTSEIREALLEPQNPAQKPSKLPPDCVVESGDRGFGSAGSTSH